MTTEEFLDTAIAERDAAIERRVREEIAAEFERLARPGNAFAYASTADVSTAYRIAARIARGGAA